MTHPLVDGAGETSEQSRPLRDGEIAEWILLDGVAICYLRKTSEVKVIIPLDPSNVREHSPPQPLPRGHRSRRAYQYYSTAQCEIYSRPVNQISGPNFGRNSSCSFLHVSIL